MPNRASRVPEDSKVALWLQAADEVRELSGDESKMVLERDPELLHQYLKQRGMTRTRGRLIVVDQQRVGEILRWVEPTD
jgi:hypothetical protein